jgi:hypothetical protein
MDEKSLTALEQCTSLESIYLGETGDGVTINWPAINWGALTNLRSISLSGDTVPSLAGVENCNALQSIRLSCGSTFDTAMMNLDVSKISNWNNAKNEAGNIVTSLTSNTVIKPIISSKELVDPGNKIYWITGAITCNYNTGNGSNPSIPITLNMTEYYQEPFDNNQTDNNQTDNNQSNNSSNSQNSLSTSDNGNTVTDSTGNTVTSTVATKVSAGVRAAVQSHRSLVNHAAGLTEEEKANGDYIEVSVYGSQCGEAAKAVIDNAAKALSAKIAQILEIEVEKMGKNGAPIGGVSLLNQAINICLSAPGDIDPQLFDFAVIRLHEGKTDILPDIDRDPNTITFETDRFSTYTVIYGSKGSFDAYKTASAAVLSPKTGDGVYFYLMILVMTALVAVAGITVIAVKRNRR